MKRLLSTLIALSMYGSVFAQTSAPGTNLGTPVINLGNAVGGSLLLNSIQALPANTVLGSVAGGPPELDAYDPTSHAPFSVPCNYTNGTTQNVDCAIAAPPPGGRLTLSSTQPVMATDVTAATTLYYLSYQGGQFIPIFNGSNYIPIPITAGLSLSTANSTNFPASTLIDVYAFMNSTTLTLCGVKWGTNIAGASARGGSAAISALNAIYVNSGAWTCNAAGTSYTLTAQEATLLGTVAITSTAQQMAFQMNPAPAAGGPVNGCWMGISNVYNEVPVTCTASDSTGSGGFTTTNTAWEPYDSAASTGGTASAGAGLYNRITWVDSVGVVTYAALLHDFGSTSTAGYSASDGIGINSITTNNGTIGAYQAAATSTVGTATAAGGPPQSAGGLNYAQALDGQMPTGKTGTFVPHIAAGQVEGLQLQITY